MARILHLIGLCTLLLAPACQVVPLTIVEDGTPLAVIIVEADAPKSLAAGEAIQHYVEKMSGARLPLVIEGQPVDDEPAIRLLVGHTQAARKAHVDIPSGFDTTVREDIFEEEGYVLKTVGNSIVIAGNNDGKYKGTHYAAHALLEMLGCRWYFPGDWGEIVPEQHTITIPALDIESRPDFAVRRYWLSGWTPIRGNERAETHEWGEKIGLNFTSFYPEVGDGGLAFLVPPDEYFQEHPEFFAMSEAGERHVGSIVHHTMLCLSNPDLLEESKKNLRAAFAGERTLGNVTDMGFGISPPDGAPYCYCSECKQDSANFAYPRYVHRTTQSEEFFGFAAELAREFPDKFASTMAYSLREIVPQGVEIPPNYMVMIAPISCDVMHPMDSELWRRRDYVRNLKAWRAQTPHITIYDYNPGFLIGNWVPERDTANWAVNAKIYRDIDIKGFRREGRKAVMQTWTSYYIMAKLLWDADADVDALKRDLYDTFFGPAAGTHVQAWWDACENELLQSTMQAHEDFFINHVYNVDFVRGIRKHIDAARSAQMTDAQRGRVEAVALIADHLMAFAQLNAAEMQMDYVDAATAAGRMVELENQLHDIYPHFIENGPMHEGVVFPAGRKKTFEALAAKMDGTVGDLVAKLPLNMKFTRDRFNEGIIGGWHQPEFDDRTWETKNTYYTWDQQDPPEDAAGHDYDGLGWYRAAFDVPADMNGRDFKFWCGGTINEGWVWINGKYAGHKAHKLWWGHPHDFEFDITDLIKPGQTNTIAIRVHNDAEIGGLFRRGFIWSPVR